MSTTAKQTTVSAVEATADRIRAINERVIDSGKQAGESSLRAYEELVKSIADAQEQAGTSSAEWVSAFGRAQARFTRELAEALPSAARSLGERAEALAEAGARQARTVPGVAQAEAELRGAVASERSLPIARYDELTVEEISERLPGLSQVELGKVDAYERKHKNRTTVHDKIASLRE
jgi:hypothetical protein